MTVPAVRAQPEPAFGMIPARFPFQQFRLLKFRPVAFPAFQSVVLPCKRPPGTLMPELLPPAVFPLNQFELPPGMVRMTSGTLGGPPAAVKDRPAPDPLPEPPMATQWGGAL